MYNVQHQNAEMVGSISESTLFHSDVLAEAGVVPKVVVRERGFHPEPGVQRPLGSLTLVWVCHWPAELDISVPLVALSEKRLFVWGKVLKSAYVNF